MKYFVEACVMYPLVHIGLCTGALAASLCFLLWDILIFIFSFGKKKL
jgi:hypothetical protein